MVQRNVADMLPNLDRRPRPLLSYALAVGSVAAAAGLVAVVDAVKQWRFTPAQANGAPVPAKVVLPVKIVDQALTGTRYAMN